MFYPRISMEISHDGVFQLDFYLSEIKRGQNLRNPIERSSDLRFSPVPERLKILNSNHDNQFYYFFEYIGHFVLNNPILNKIFPKTRD